MNRIDEITAGLPLQTGRGLEIAPLFRPILTKSVGKVDYTDYMSTAELRERDKSHPDVGNLVDVDFVWAPGDRLKNSAGGREYDYVVSSHVLEHVPNPIGWLEQTLEVCKPGAIISMALPTKYNPIDFLRENTTISEWVGSYVEARSIPSAQQVFDCLHFSRTFPPARPGEYFTREEVLAMPSGYTAEQALGFAHRAYSHQVYTDVHCSVFTLESFRQILQASIDLGLLNIEILDLHTANGADERDVPEFYVQLKKVPPSIRAAAWDGVSPFAKLSKVWGLAGVAP
jgi:SAM-dependent methyltransferase